MAKTATVTVRPGTPTKSKPSGKGAPSPAKSKPAPPEKLPSTRRVSFADDVLPTGGREAPASAPPKPTAPPKSAASPKPPKAPASPKPAASAAKGKGSDGNSSGSGSSRSKGPGGLQPAPVMPPVPPPLPPEAPAPALSAKPPTHEIASAKPALVRVGEELSSDKVSELPAGTRVTVLETREQPGGATRARVALEGQAQAHGWLTASTKDGSENLRALLAPAAASTSSSEGGSGSSSSRSGSGSGGSGSGGGSASASASASGSSARAASPAKPKSARAASPAKPKPPKGPPVVNGSVNGSVTKPKGKEKEAPEAAPADKRPPKPPPPPPPPRQRGFEDLSDTQEEALIGLMFDDFVVAHRMKSLDYDKVRRFAMTIQQDPAVCSTLATPPVPGDELMWVPSEEWITDPSPCMHTLTTAPPSSPQVGAIG